MRARYAVVAMLFIAALMVAGCKGPAVETPAVEPPKPEPTAVTAVEEPPKTEVAVEEPAEPVTITVWSHWTDQPSKKKVVQQAMDDYMAEHPNVTIQVEWWQKADMWPAMQNAFTVGEGAPDFFYFDRDSEHPLAFVDAGWIDPLEDVIDWNLMTNAAKEYGTWTNINGETHTWFAVLEASPNLLLYNPAIFDELGIVVPDNYQFTADEFFDVALKCRKAGYDPLATGASDRKYPGQYMYKYALISKLGMDEFIKLWNGERSFEDPEVLEVLEWIQGMIEIPAMPATYITMTLAESHQYFHTTQKACMFPIGAWYTGRTFKPAEEGGQSADFRNGFLKYPAFPGGVGTNQGQWGTSGGMALWANSPNLKVAEDLMRFFMQEKYGNMWLAETAIPTGIITDPSAISEDHPYRWYFEEFDKAYGDYDWKVDASNPCVELRVAYEAYINDGLAAQLLTLDEAIAAIEEARLFCNPE